MTLRSRVVRFLFGDQPRALVALCAPTSLAILVDLVLRARLMGEWATQGKLIYLSSTLISAAFWFLPLYFATRLAVVVREGGPRRKAAAIGLGALFALWFFPLVTFCFPGQILYRNVNAVYMGRNTLRLGIAFRTTLRDWFASWAGPAVVLAIVASGLLVAAALAFAVHRASASRPRSVPALSVLTFVVALGCFWVDLVDSRFLQAATPDACFVHGLVHTVRVAVSGQWGVRQGVSLRTPAPLPALTSEREKKPNVLVILTESVRADSMCSETTPKCVSAELDAVVPDRIPLGKLTTPTPNTFSACVMLWTGLQATTDFGSAHTAPVLWEVAHAVGYRTAYITSQNPNYEDFGVYVRHAGIDVLQTATDLGGMRQEQLGAPDERATAAALEFMRAAPSPYFALVQLANTHMPYRVAPDLEPNEPHSSTPVGDASAFKNQYKNSILLQERILGAFLREVRALPSWDNTVVIFLSDHGEQFREHHGLYHNHSFFEEEIRIPGWVAAGPSALDESQRAALATYRGVRTFTQDIHATVVDLFGLHGARQALPYGDAVVGRSLLRPRAPDPATLLATSTAVWEPTDSVFGVMQGERLLVGNPTASWSCYDIARDPREKAAMPGERCPDLLDVARRAFANLKVAK